MPFRNWLATLPLRLRTLFRRDAVEAELEEEMRYHLERETERLMGQRGLTPEAARFEARRALGNLTALEEESRETWGWTRWEILRQDTRHAGRALRKSPGFTLTATLTLALAIGASTAVFTVVDSVLLRPLAFEESARLVAIWEKIPALDANWLGPNRRHADVWRREVSALAEVAYAGQGTGSLGTGDGPPYPVGTVAASTSLFRVLRAKPHLGRLFETADGAPGGGDVAVISHELWRGAFAGDRNIIGRRIRVREAPYAVIGVLPADFHFPNRNALRPMAGQPSATNVMEPAIFLPASDDLSRFSWFGDFGNGSVLGRLAPGVTMERAQAELDGVQARLVEGLPQRKMRRQDMTAHLQPLQEAIVGSSRKGLWLLMAAVLSLLLTACLNLANAQLARSVRRQRETGVRRALGAPGWRLTAGVLLENLLLALMGGSLGVALAFAGLRLFQQNAGVDLPRLTEVRPDGRVLVFAAALMVGAAALFSLWPILRNAGVNPGARTIGTRHGRRTQRWLIAAQVSGCTALLLVTGLFTRNLLHWMNQEKGFTPAELSYAQVSLNGPAYAQPESRRSFIDGVLGRIGALPGVEAAGFVSTMPLEGEAWIEPLARMDQPGTEPPLVNLRWVNPGYFAAMRHRLKAGRWLEERDREERSVLLSESEVRMLWRDGGDPVGAKVRLQGQEYTVVGVVGDALNTSLKAPPPRVAYVHYAHRPPGNLFFLARATGGLDPARLRDAIHGYAPGVMVARAKTMDAQVRESLAAERFQTFVLVAFGVSALLLAMIGIYGVTSHAVTEREREIGVRIALGASRRSIYELAFGEVGGAVIGGLLAGLAAGAGAARLAASLVDGGTGLDWTAGLVVAVAFLVAAGVASFAPARRAASVDPLLSLRAE